MVEEAYQPAMVAIYSNDEGLLKSFQALARTRQSKPETSKRARRIEDAKFDPLHVALMAYHVGA